MKKTILVGGQAIIEGVMMRVPGAYAAAVRKPDGEIEKIRKDTPSFSERHPIFKKVLLRGVLALFESMKLGFSILQWSADVAIQAEDELQGKTTKKENKFITFITTVFAFALGIGLFVILPLFLTTVLLNIEKSAFSFNLVSGVFRIIFFLVYLWAISFMKDVQRLFQYHGAEHKVVYTFEKGKELTVENTREFSTFHPRCGTSFIFIVLLVSIVMFALIDTVVIFFVGKISLGIRIFFHLALLPLVAGTGYEFLKLTAANQHRTLARWLTKPGLWLQRITTKPPTDEQIEVAIISLKYAFGDKLKEYEGKEYVADAIG